MADLASLIALARPKHWIKNLFVLMPLPHALASGGTLQPSSFALALGGFCLVNSAVYALNDSLDAEQDRRHVAKRHRPVASGKVSVGTARLVALVLVAAGLALGWLAAVPGVLGLFGVYIAITLVYSLWGRALALIDVFLLCAGFLLRVVLGCTLVGVEPSSWLLLCTSTLALFLSLAKRRDDLALGMDETQRPSLAGYDARFLDHAMTVSSATAVVAYALYCLESPTLVPGRELASLPFVILGVLESLRQVHLRGAGGSPVDLLLGSPLLLLCGAGWVGATLWSVGI